MNIKRNSNQSTMGLVIINKDQNIELVNGRATEIFESRKREQYLEIFKTNKSAFCIIDLICEVEITQYNDMQLFLIKDKEEYKEIKQKLELSYIVEEELQQVINSSFDGITIIDKDGVILHQNPASEEITGLSADTLVGKNINYLVENGIFDHSVTLKVLKENMASTIIQQISTGKQVLVSGAPVRDKAGNIIKVVCSTRDLTVLKELENSIIDLQEKNTRVKQELEQLRNKYDTYGNLITNDRKTKDLIQRAYKVAQIDSVILVKGESGVGKEGIVNYIHTNSARSDKPLLKINCGAIPEQLLESELFGYESGAFTGANQTGKKGLFETAQGGTIFLDELGEMPLRLQVSLLRVLQEYEITRVGGVNPIKVDVRIIAATNVNLEKKVKEKKFREDLYYRINVIPINVPALRERKDDIVPLVYHFQNQIKEKYGIYRQFSDEVLTAFQNQHWPGNVRELKNLVERVSLMINKKVIEFTDIEKELKVYEHFSKSDYQNNLSSRNNEEIPLKQQVIDFEKEIIQKSLNQYPSIRKAAKALQIDQSTLVRKMQRYNMSTN